MKAFSAFLAFVFFGFILLNVLAIPAWLCMGLGYSAGLFMGLKIGLSVLAFLTLLPLAFVCTLACFTSIFD